MKVILLQDIRGLGKRHEVREVRDGYGQNFLIAKKLAVPATKEEEIKRHKEAEKERTEREQLKTQAKNLEKKLLIFNLTTGAQGEVFSAVGKDDIIKTLKAQGIKNIKEIELEKPIRVLGRHTATLHLKHGIHAVLTIETKETN